MGLQFRVAKTRYLKVLLKFAVEFIGRTYMSKRRCFGKGFVLSFMTLLLLQCCGSVHKALARSVSAGRPVGSQSGLAVGQRIVKASLSSYQWAFMIPDLQKLAEEVESGDSRSLLIPPPGGIKKPWKSLHKLGTFARYRQSVG